MEHDSKKPELALRVDDLLIVELDDRLEMAAAILADTNYGCNAKDCTQNVYCPQQ